jgi:hypothetical protein
MANILVILCAGLLLITLNFLLFKDGTGMCLMFGVNEHSQNVCIDVLTVSREDFRSIYLFCFSNYLKGFFYMSKSEIMYQAFFVFVIHI